jgi:hypothetical protein
LVTSLGVAEVLEDTGSTRLREQLAERDEIIVALQHVICDLRHEIDNLHAEHVFGALARRGRETPG